MAGNKSLNKACKAKEDEFYTKITDIEKELKHYKDEFKDKTVFLNCDDPESSNFWEYFVLNFTYLGLKKLIATHFESDKSSYKLEYDGKEIKKSSLMQNGDFRSPECIVILKEADIIVTNPPFSLFREFMAQLIENDKKFIIIGNQNAITYKEVFSLLRDNKVWLGYCNGDMEFLVPDYYTPRATRFRIDENGQKYRSLGNICWFTNLDTTKRHENIILFKNYNEKDFPNYDNYDAINVDKVADIPVDYCGTIGVPITFMNKYNPEQFKLIGIDRYVEDNPYYGKRFTINGREIYARILISRRVITNED